jgi:hypothetical protein
MRIVLINNTAGEFPLIGGIPNLGPYAKQVLEITTVTFESLKYHLDLMKAKGLISYHTDQDDKPSSKTEISSITIPELPNTSKEDIILLRTELDTASSEIDSRLLGLEASLQVKIEVLESLVLKLSANLAATKPNATILRVDSSNAVSMSRNSYEPINGTEVTIPSSGMWLILAEIGVYSPVASKGNVAVGRLGSDSNDKIYQNSERSWLRINDSLTSIYSSLSTELVAGDKLSLYWKVSEGVIRGTYRSLTLISM